MSLWGIPVDEEGLQKKRMKISAFQRQGLTSFSAKWPPPPPFRFTISNFLGEFGILHFQLHSSSFFTGFCICSKSKSLLLSHTHWFFFCFSDSCHEARKKEGSRLFLYCLFISKMIPSEKEVEKLMDTSESCWVKCHFSYLVFQFIFDKMNNEWNGRTVVDRKT